MVPDKAYKLDKGSAKLWNHFITIMAVKGLLITCAYFCKSNITLRLILVLSIYINFGCSSQRLMLKVWTVLCWVLTCVS